MKKTRVMIVDDSRVARELFELYLKGNDNYKVVCVEESASFADTFSKSAAIDVIIMDILMMPEKRKKQR